MLSHNFIKNFLLILISFFISCTIKHDHQKSAYHFSRGEEYLNQGDWKKAGIHFKKARQYDPNNFKAHDKYIDVEFHYFEHKEKVRNEYRKLLEQTPSSPLLHYFYGMTLAGDSDECYDQMHKAIALDSTFIHAYRSLVSSYNFYQKSNQAAQIQETFKKRFPNSFHSLFSQAVQFGREGKLDEKKKTLQMIIANFPDSSETAFAYLHLADLTIDIDEKIALLERALTFKFSDQMPLVYGRLFHLYANRDSAKAVQLAQKAMSIKPPIADKRVPSDAMRNLFYFYVKRDTVKALELAKKAANESDITSPDLHHAIGNKLINMEQELPLAIKLIEKAVKQNTPEIVYGNRAFGKVPFSRLKNNVQIQEPYYLNDLGWAYYKLGDFEKAQKILNRASGKSEDAEASIQYRLGLTYEKLGDSQAAIQAYTKSLAVEENEKVRKALENLLERETALKIAIPDCKSLNIDSLIVAAQLSEAKQAPDFTLMNLEGESISLSNFKEKVLVLDFWATWCGPCVAELPHLQKLVDSFKSNDNVAFLAISCDFDTSTVKKFMKEKGYTIPVVMNKGIDQAYDVHGIPTLFVVDPNGMIRYKHVGYDGNVDFVKLMTKEINLVLGEVN